MARHLICLTIDTDPDGLAARAINRQTLVWRGLEQIPSLLEALDGSGLGPIPITWFIRADGQLRDILGSPLYLLERFELLWAEARDAGSELAWHPHLYRHLRSSDTARLITDPLEAAEEIEELWSVLSDNSFRPVSFRNGEGWHHAATFETVERLGFLWDSTAIPGRQGAEGHPMDWRGAPNEPYFPDQADIRQPGKPRRLLEIPMNSWRLRASYDSGPQLRYINPAVHEPLFIQALETLRSEFSNKPSVWTLILHPDEVLAGAAPDLLYARSVKTVCRNLETLTRAIREAGHEVTFTTMSQAGSEWRSGGAV